MVYLFKDHLGSAATYTDSNGAVLERASFDAFGKRRASNWQALLQPFSQLTNLSALQAISERGFTGHIQIDHADLVHMGGRVYDPNVGRFIQADPIVEDPRDAQTLNRYSYVLNNPLSYTDPTGYACEGRGNQNYRECNNAPNEDGNQSGDSEQGALAKGDNKTQDISDSNRGNSAPAAQNACSVMCLFGQILPEWKWMVKDAVAKAIESNFLMKLSGELFGVEAATEGAIEFSQGNVLPAAIALAESRVPGSRYAEKIIEKVEKVTKGAKRGPKTDPNAPHNKKIREIGDQIEAQYGPGSIKAGGGRLPEVLLPTPGGHKNGRRPDILYENDCGVLCAINVGKAKKNGMPIKREQQALDDLNNSGIPTTFQRYN